MTRILINQCNDILRQRRKVYPVEEAEQVDALLFIKSLPEGENKLTAENLYIVPLQS